MGFFGKMFGGGPDYPELASNTEAAARIEAIRGNLEELARDVSDPLEVVPSEAGAYVFIGKPPKRFGIAWIEGNEIKSFKSLMAEHGVSGETVAKVSDELREIYQRHQDENRFHAKVAERDVVVTPSEGLEHEVRDILLRLH
jgi:uncharacterized protein YoaH (UPF0181 family)